MLRFVSVFLFFMLVANSSVASIDVYEFGSDDQRKRYQMFLEELRCPKCKNNNLAGTNSQIAVDLRRELHKMVAEGKTDAEIIDFMVSRYGDFVLYRPRIQTNTLVLWLGPLVFLGLGLTTAGVIVFKRRRLVPAVAELSEQEQKELEALLQEGHSTDSKKKKV